MECTGSSRGGPVNGMTAVALTSAGAIARATVVCDDNLLHGRPADHHPASAHGIFVRRQIGAGLPSGEVTG